jgi:hypothetical protein
MTATTTQLLSSGEFSKLRYDIIPVKSASANVSFYTDKSKMPNFELRDTLVANERYIFYIVLLYNVINNIRRIVGTFIMKPKAWYRVTCSE